MSHVIEALSIGNIVDDYYPVSVPVVTVGDSAEPLLSSSIPLSQLKSTNTNLAFSPLTVTVLVF